MAQISTKMAQIFTFEEISSVGVKIFTFDEFRRVTNFSVPEYSMYVRYFILFISTTILLLLLEQFRH
jgi:hypothetical protein